MSRAIMDLQPGRYWITFRAMDGSDRRRRVLVERGSDDLLRAHWATEAWRPEPKQHPSDVGLQVDLMDATVRFEAVSSDPALVIDEHSQAPAKRRQLRDVAGNDIRPGVYSIRRSGQTEATPAQVVEDQIEFELWITIRESGHDVLRRLDELPSDFIFERLTD